MKVGFIGLGNVGSKLCGTLLRNGTQLHVLDLNPELVADFVNRGAHAAESPKQMAEAVEIVIIASLSSPSYLARNFIAQETCHELRRPTRRPQPSQPLPVVWPGLAPTDLPKDGGQRSRRDKSGP